jgi:hypothetical protein
MHRVHVFLRLSGTERLLVLEALAVVVAMRLGLWLFPFQKLRALVTEIGQHAVRSNRAETLPADRIVWAVRAVGQFVPYASCLTQALAGQALLARRRHPTRLHIGVARTSQDGLIAHAWLEYKGRIVLGDHGFLATYTAFPSLE